MTFLVDNHLFHLKLKNLVQYDISKLFHDYFLQSLTVSTEEAEKYNSLKVYNSESMKLSLWNIVSYKPKRRLLSFIRSAKEMNNKCTLC